MFITLILESFHRRLDMRDETHTAVSWPSVAEKTWCLLVPVCSSLTCPNWSLNSRPPAPKVDALPMGFRCGLERMFQLSAMHYCNPHCFVSWWVLREPRTYLRHPWYTECSITCWQQTADCQFQCPLKPKQSAASLHWPRRTTVFLYLFIPVLICSYFMCLNLLTTSPDLKTNWTATTHSLNWRLTFTRPGSAKQI